MLRERLQKDLIEPSYTPYRNSFFLVKKKGDKYRLINNAVKINRITIRDGNLPPTVNEFSKKFDNYIIISLINFFSGYNQIELNEKFKDLINFHIPIRLYRITTLP